MKLIIMMLVSAIPFIGFSQGHVGESLWDVRQHVKEKELAISEGFTDKKDPSQGLYYILGVSQDIVSCYYFSEYNVCVGSWLYLKGFSKGDLREAFLEKGWKTSRNDPDILIKSPFAVEAKLSWSEGHEAYIVMFYPTK